MQLNSSVSAVVTGGASGLGAATARRLASHGVKVALFDLNEAQLWVLGMRWSLDIDAFRAQLEAGDVALQFDHQLFRRELLPCFERKDCLCQRLLQPQHHAEAASAVT